MKGVPIYEGTMHLSVYTEQELTSYTVDSEDKILDLNEGWEAFARANHGDGLTLDTLRGQVLWDFIADPQVRQVWRYLFARVRQTQRAITVPYRCDSPEMKREYNAHLAPEQHGRIRYENHVYRETPREPVRVLALDRSEHTEDFIKMCSWCKSIEHNGRWLALEDAVADLALLCNEPLPQLSHGICPQCYTKVLEAAQ